MDDDQPMRKIYAVRRSTVSTAKRAELRIDHDPCDLFSAKPTFFGSFDGALDEAQFLAEEEADERGGKLEIWAVVRDPSSTVLTIYEPVAIELEIAPTAAAEAAEAEEAAEAARVVARAAAAKAPTQVDGATQEAPTQADGAGACIPNAEGRP
jgi:hypothetical protein